MQPIFEHAAASCSVQYDKPGRHAKLYSSFHQQDHTLVNSTRFSEVTPDLEIRLRGLLNLPNAAERHLYELPQIQVNGGMASPFA